MFRRFSHTAAALLFMTGVACADDIVGNWKTDSGETAAITGGGPFLVTVKTGKHAGKRIGTLSTAGDGKYTGEITDPATDKTYSGKAALSGDNLKMSGCVLGGLICKSQNWQRM
ncbi:MAG: DUF2147 domain-containing protein [Rhizobiaceae bacterium]|nr:DUF2147 domain-containing protein [Rhizobiaceae bacterium]